MKVVLFCGGLGTRLREHSETIPKPLVNIGYRPILWHLMRYYAYYGHKEFILALGYRGDMIREYFLRYNECMTSDFTLSGDLKQVELHGRDISDWRITFVDTGLHSTTAERLLRVRRYLGDDEMFLANYSDGLSDIPLDQMIALFRASGAVASLAAVRSLLSFHTVQADADGTVTGIGTLRNKEFLINGGFFAMRPAVLDYIGEGEELTEEPFARLIAQRRLYTYRHLGYWQPMDTFKDKITFDRMEARGNCPWKVWERSEAEPGGPARVAAVGERVPRINGESAIVNASAGASGAH